MKKKLFVFFFIVNCFNVFCQNIEKLIDTFEIHTAPYDGYDNEFGFGLACIYTNQLEDTINLYHSYYGNVYIVDDGSFQTQKNTKSRMFCYMNQINNYYFNVEANSIKIFKNKEKSNRIFIDTGAGISFILKKDNEYIVYFVDKNGMPGAIDTACNKYNNKEAVEYLKSYDSEKYEESRQRAEQLGLLEEFELNNVLVWGQIYYSTVGILKDFWKPERYLYPYRGAIQYDLSGIGYQQSISSIITSKNDNDSQIVIVSQDGKWMNSPIKIHDSSNILVRHYNEKDKSSINSEMVVGFSGNIYYYISDEKETEVFRIRNTWDSTNLYALAVNGYTEDEYGKYVNEVLPKLSKAELRLLRNTVFALYGVHFKSEDLSKHFDKQVWYTDEGKSSADVTLPAHRQKLVEIIMLLEK